jgi:hypothetical protein
MPWCLICCCFYTCCAKCKDTYVHEFATYEEYQEFKEKGNNNCHTFMCCQ